MLFKFCIKQVKKAQSLSWRSSQSQRDNSGEGYGAERLAQDAVGVQPRAPHRPAVCGAGTALQMR